jgi:hypothetical protein
LLRPGTHRKERRSARPPNPPPVKAQPEVIGDLAFEHRIRLHELAPAQASLEGALMELTADSVEFRAHPPEQLSNHAAGDSDRVHATGVA